MKAVSVPDWLLERGTPVGKEEHPLKDIMAMLLDELHEDDQRALEMWAYEGLTYEEIAHEFGLAGKQGGHYRVKRALARLGELIETTGAEV